MDSGVKKIYWGGVGAVFLLLLLGLLALIIPGLVDPTWLKSTIKAQAAKQVTGEFDFQKAELVIVPYPAVSLQQANLSIPETAKIHFETIKIYPEILPLFLGKINLDKIVIDAPDFSLPLPQKSLAGTGEGILSDLIEFLEAVSSGLPPVLKVISDLDIDIKQGALHFFSKDSQVILIDNFNGDFKIENQSLSAAISSFTAFHKNEKTIAKLEKLKGRILYSEQVTKITVEDLSLSYPKVRLSGSYILDQRTPHASLDISSQKVNIAEISEMLPVVINTFYGELPEVREISDLLKGGTISHASLHVEGKSPTDLAVFEAIRFKAKVTDGEISFSDLGLDLQEVTGDVLITNGIFEGKDLQVRIADSTGSGNTFILPLRRNSLFLLDNFSLSSQDKMLRLNSALINFNGNEYTLNGKVSMVPEGLSFDLDVKADSIDLDKIFAASEHENEPEISKTEIVKSPELEVQGKIRLQANSLHNNNYTWKPFRSDISVENSSLAIEIIEAELCSISMPGILTLKNGKITLDFKLEAIQKESREFLVCLEGGEQQMTGIMELNATVKGKGNRETLLSSLEGSLQYSSTNGYIYEDAKLAKLLYILDVTNLFQGKIPDLRSTGFHYDSIIVKGTMEKGVLTVTPARLDAPIMEISAYGTVDIPQEKVDFQVLVAPLQTLNKLQKLLPVINTILPESLVAVPVEVSGDFSNIEARTLSISAISRSVFGIMVDALATPVRVLEDTTD